MKNILPTNNIEQSYKNALLKTIEILINVPKLYFQDNLTDTIIQNLKASHPVFKQLQLAISKIPCTDIIQPGKQYYHSTYATILTVPETEFLLIWNQELIKELVKKLTPVSIPVAVLKNFQLIEKSVNPERIDKLLKNFDYTPIIIGQLPPYRSVKILDGNHRAYAAELLGIKQIQVYLLEEENTIACFQSNSFKQLYLLNARLNQEIEKCFFSRMY